MGLTIHARKFPGREEFTYRVWSSITDSYVTGELDAVEVDDYVLRESVMMAIEAHRFAFPDRMERARRTGTSSMIGDAPGVTAGWEHDPRAEPDHRATMPALNGPCIRFDPTSDGPEAQAARRALKLG